MTSDEELKLIDDEILSIDDEINRLNSAKYDLLEKLNGKKHLILMKKLSEEDWLRNSEWKLGIQHSKVFIELRKSAVEEIVSNLRKLFDVSWHSSVHLTENLHMRFDDNEIRIFIHDDLPEDDIELQEEYCINKYKIGLVKLIEFVNSYGIKVDFTMINSEIERLQYLESLKNYLIDALIKY